MTVIRARDNSRVRRWQRLARDAGIRRAENRTLIEGVHLVEEYLASGREPAALIAAEAHARSAEFASLLKRCRVPPVLVSNSVFAAIANADSPAGIAAEIEIPARGPLLPESDCCALLDGVQDAGNVGTIMRSAAAFGVTDVVLGPGCADPWSPKVLRAGMGAHFRLRLGVSKDLAADLESFGGIAACALPRGGVSVAEADLTERIAWILGSEGGGVSEQLAARARLKVSIPMPGAAESLNVAIAAAILFYERSRQLSRRAARC